MRIGVFDSGIGGLSVLHRAKKMMPNAHFIYNADVQHVPYGEKTVDEVRRYVKEALDFLISKEVDAILIACNTATTVATPQVRAQFPVPIVGMEPAVKRAVELYKQSEKRILVAATPITIAGQKLQTLLDRVDVDHNVDLIPLPGLVHFAERGEFASEEVDEYLKEALKDLDLTSYTALVLGCTHFNYFKFEFQKIFSKEIHFVDGNEGAVRQLIRLLEASKALQNDTESKQQHTQNVEFYFSGVPAVPMQLKHVNNCLEQLDRVFEIE